MSKALRHLLGRWWVCLLLLVVVLWIFGFVVQPAAEAVVAHGAHAPKILDEYIMTWTPADAEHLYASIGPDGRQAYREYYLHLDFWFPVFTMTLFYMSLLSLAFPKQSRFAWLNLLPIAMWLLDAAENINHFTMAGSYPNLPAFSLQYGPYFTWSKYAVMFAVPVLALAGFVGRLFAKRRPERA